MAGALAAVLALVVAGCGQSPEDALAETQARLGELRSGRVAADVLAEGRGRGAARRGFELSGPFALDGRGRLRDAELAYTQVSGGDSAAATFVAAGGRAWAVAGGEATRLDRTEEEMLLGSAVGGRLRALELSAWFREPELSDGPAVDGQPTDRIAGGLDVAAALGDLGGPLADGAKAIAGSVSSARVEILTGREDRQLRALEVRIELDRDGGRALERELGDLAGGRLSLALTLEDHGSRIRVRPPAGSG